MSMTSAHSGRYKCRATNSKTGQYFDLKEYNIMIYTDSGIVQHNASIAPPWCHFIATMVPLQHQHGATPSSP